MLIYWRRRRQRRRLFEHLAPERAEYGDAFVDALGRFVGGLLAEGDIRAGIVDHTSCLGSGAPYCVPFSE